MVPDVFGWLRCADNLDSSRYYFPLHRLVAVQGFHGVTAVLKQLGESFLKDPRLWSYEKMTKRRWSNETGFYLGHNPNAGGVPDQSSQQARHSTRIYVFFSKHHLSIHCRHLFNLLVQTFRASALRRRHNRVISSSGWTYIVAWIFLGDSSCLGKAGEEAAINRGILYRTIYNAHYTRSRCPRKGMKRGI